MRACSQAHELAYSLSLERLNLMSLCNEYTISLINVSKIYWRGSFWVFFCNPVSKIPSNLIILLLVLLSLTVLTDFLFTLVNFLRINFFLVYISGILMNRKKHLQNLSWNETVYMHDFRNPYWRNQHSFPCVLHCFCRWWTYIIGLATLKLT